MLEDAVLPSLLVNAYGGSPPPVDQPGLAAMPSLKSKSKVDFGGSDGDGSSGLGDGGGGLGDGGGGGLGDGGGGLGEGGVGEGDCGVRDCGAGGSEGGAAGSAAPQLTATSATAASPDQELPRVYSKANDGE